MIYSQNTLANYLFDMFPNIKGLTFLKPELLGKKNILLIIEHLEAMKRDAQLDYKQAERRRGNMKSIPGSAELELVEHLNGVIIKNLMNVIKWLKEMDGVSSDTVSLPALRTPSFFASGEQVMVYLPVFADELGNPKRLVKEHWVPATFLRTGTPDNSLAYIVTNVSWYEPTSSYTSPYMYQAPVQSPYVWKLSEFQVLEKLKKVEGDPFLNILMQNCGYKKHGRPWTEKALRKVLFDQHVLNLSKTECKDALKRMLDDTVGNGSTGIVLGLNFAEILKKVALKRNVQIAMAA